MTHSIRIEADSDAVFRALTTEDGVRGWWNQRAKISGDVGGVSTYQFSKGGSEVHMEFRNTRLDPELVSWHCTANDNAAWIGSDVSWTLRSVEGGTELTLRHENFPDSFADTEGYRMVSGGWQHFLGSLAAWVTSGRGQPFE